MDTHENLQHLIINGVLVQVLKSQCHNVPVGPMSFYLPILIPFPHLPPGVEGLSG